MTETAKALSVKIANYMLDKNKSVVDTALHFGIANSTASKYLKALKEIDIDLYNKTELHKQEKLKQHRETFKTLKSGKTHRPYNLYHEQAWSRGD